jgi:hypothetical protein
MQTSRQQCRLFCFYVRFGCDTGVKNTCINGISIPTKSKRATTCSGSCIYQPVKIISNNRQPTSSRNWYLSNGRAPMFACWQVTLPTCCHSTPRYCCPGPMSSHLLYTHSWYRETWQAYIWACRVLPSHNAFPPSLYGGLLLYHSEHQR